MLVNHLGYRQTENVWSQPEPGHNVVLTLGLDIQQAAERSLAAHQGADARAAVVVMDVRTGDVLAMVSSPAINPDYPANDPARLNDMKLRPQINRATYENYAPGSIFKTVVGLACAGKWTQSQRGDLQSGLPGKSASRLHRDRAAGHSGHRATGGISIFAAPFSVPATPISSPMACGRALKTLSAWGKNVTWAIAPAC